MMLCTTAESPLGELLLVGEESATAPGGIALASLSLPGQKGGVVVHEGLRHDDKALSGVTSQLGAYFAGELTHFDLEFVRRGSDFRQKVWSALDTIPHGSTLTYGEVATRIGAPRAAVRAVGTAIGANPLLVVRPCHRVIGKDGSLTGYAGGIERKRQLLVQEGVLQAV